MKPVHSRSVYRYFDPTDAFVQILLCDPEQLKLQVERGMNRKAYRRLVIQTCMPQFEGEFDDVIGELLPEDPLLGEDLLYQLCVEVNPSLNIHTVRLFDEAAAPAPHAAPQANGEDDDHEGFLRRLRKRAHHLERRLAQRLIGQDEAVHATVRTLRRAAAGLGAADRPLGSLLFVGRTGTGKTELARALAEEVFGKRSSERALVRIDCSEFAHAHEYSKLIGAPPGYVGHQDGGHLTEALLKSRECVVLFDEIEKAHPKLHNLLLQILEEGALTDGRGRRVSFDRALVLLTSNAGAEEILSATRSVGFGGQEVLDGRSQSDITTRALEERFSPEFLGRIDEVLHFRDLDGKAARQIAQLKLTDLALRSRRRGLAVAFTPAVAQWVAQRGFSPQYGAREIRRVIQREIEPRVAELLAAGEARPGVLLRARVQREELLFEFDA